MNAIVHTFGEGVRLSLVREGERPQSYLMSAEEALDLAAKLMVAATDE